MCDGIWRGSGLPVTAKSLLRQSVSSRERRFQLGPLDLGQYAVSVLHRHATEIRYKVCALGMTSELAFWGSSSVIDRLIAQASTLVSSPLHLLGTLRPRGKM